MDSRQRQRAAGRSKSRRGPGTFHCLVGDCKGRNPISMKNRWRHQHQGNFVECIGTACEHCLNQKSKYRLFRVTSSISRHIVYFASPSSIAPHFPLLRLTFLYCASPSSIAPHLPLLRLTFLYSASLFFRSRIFITTSRRVLPVLRSQD